MSRHIYLSVNMKVIDRWVCNRGFTRKNRSTPVGGGPWVIYTWMMGDDLISVRVEGERAIFRDHRKDGSVRELSAMYFGDPNFFKTLELFFT